jgi:hypothetical protein
VQRLPVGSRNTTHFEIIPVLGYSGKRALISRAANVDRWVASTGRRSRAAGARARGAEP